MKKKTLIFSIIAVLLLTLVSLSNVVGYNSVKNTQEELITSEYDFDECKEYLFETLVDISNNPEVKNLINSNNHNLLPNTNNRMLLPFRRYNNRASLSVEHLDLLYNLGLKIVDRIGEDKLVELMENIDIDNPEMYEQIDTIIMSDGELADRIYTLNKMNSEKLSWDGWRDNPIICLILTLITIIFGGISLFPIVIGTSTWYLLSQKIFSILLLLVFSPIIAIGFISFNLMGYFNCVSFYPY